MIRVLHVFGGLGTGGTESLIMNWYRNIDRTKIQFDFLVRSSDSNYLDEIESLGGRVFFTASFPRHFIRNYKETKTVLEKREWEIIHVHGNAAMYLLPLQLAKKLGYTQRIMHSHSVKAQNPVFNIVHLYNRKKFQKYATHCLSCSEKAGFWMYANSNFTVLKNTVDSKKFLYNQQDRECCRRNFNVENSFVVGHIGRFAMPKNHDFLLDVFLEIRKKKSNSKLLLVGDGELKETIKIKAKQLGIDADVIFAGRRTDIGALMSAMDIFLLPSLFEGMPVVCVECCANELPVVISKEAYTKELESLPNISKLSLDCSAEEWADFVLSIEHNGRQRGTQRMIECCGYDIVNIISDLEKIYGKV